MKSCLVGITVPEWITLLNSKIFFFVSKQKAAYTYLNQTIETFPYGQGLIEKMEEAGFVTCTAHPLTLGVASLYVGHLMPQRASDGRAWPQANRPPSHPWAGTA